MPLNKGYPTKNTIVTPKASHHTLHSPWGVVCLLMLPAHYMLGGRPLADVVTTLHVGSGPLANVAATLHVGVRSLF
jgi:hypothetical protein